MSHGLSLSPDGRLVWERNTEHDSEKHADPLPPSVASKLQASFDQSNALGLLELTALRTQSELIAPSLKFWQGFARRLFLAILGLGESAAELWKDVPPPAVDVLEELASSAPPMLGLEYLNCSMLQHLWGELAREVSARASVWADGPAAYLHQIDPLFHQLGRVTFHLAENKRDALRPFAFLVTYAHRITERSKLAHLPLGEALKTYANAKDVAKLKSLLRPVERAAETIPLVRDLLERKALFAPQAWSVRQAYAFLKEAARMEEAGVIVRLPDWWSVRRPPRPQVRVNLGERQPSGLGLDSVLDFEVELALDGSKLTEAERQALLASTEGLMLLRGKWVEVDRERIQEALAHWRSIQSSHPDGVDFIQGMRLLSGAGLTHSEATQDEVADWSSVTAGGWLRSTIAKLKSPETGGDCQPGRDLQAALRPYQVEGVHWLWLITQLGLGGCLADDMGLGKTIQVIDLLMQQRRLRDPQVASPNLLVAPASLLGNWRQELQRFAPSLKLFILHRSETDAVSLERCAADPSGRLREFDLVATTYGFVRQQPWLSKVKWSLVILDEAQAIKNSGSSQTKCVKQLKARARLALTGTPIENQLGDLWSLFDFVCPGLLGTAGEFKKYVKKLGERSDPEAFASLRRLVRPYILRRLKTDPKILPDLPLKTELRTECGLTKKQAVMYERVVNDLSRQLQQAEGMARRGLVLASMMQLKQICNHPSQHLHCDAYPPDESGKFERLRLLCEPIVERQERALVFTQFQTLTEPLAEWLRSIFHRPGLVLHGGTPIKKRSELVREFQAEGGPPFFVISLKAGGSGLNLTAASHVIHFDRWWNPAVENQATDRAFRIGQKRNVLVHKFVCRGTVEERIDELIASKREVAEQIIGADDEGEVKLTEMSNDELLGFVALDLRRALSDD